MNVTKRDITTQNLSLMWNGNILIAFIYFIISLMLISFSIRKQSIIEQIVRVYFLVLLLEKPERCFFLC